MLNKKSPLVAKWRNSMAVVLRRIHKIILERHPKEII